MPEIIHHPTPPPSEDGYNVAAAQQFLQTVGQFNQENLHPDLAKNLEELDLVWDCIDNMISTDPSRALSMATERIYSGFTEVGQYFEVYGDPLYFGNDKVIHVGRVVFQVDLASLKLSALRPDAYVDPNTDFMQLRFGHVAPGLPLLLRRPVEPETKTGSKDGEKAEEEPEAPTEPAYEKDAPDDDNTTDLGVAGRPYLQLGTREDYPAEDFFYSRRDKKRRILVDTSAYQDHTGLFASRPRQGLYMPDIPFTER